MLAEGSEVLSIAKLLITEHKDSARDDANEDVKITKSPKMLNTKPEHFRFVEPLSDI